MPGADMGIDLGTSNTLIYLSGKGIMLNEPSIVAIDRETGDVVAMGKPAQQMMGRTSDRLDVIAPLCNGVVSDYTYTQKMLEDYVHRVSNNAVFNPRVVICVPSELTEVERRAAVDAVRQAGARKICLLEEPMAAAIGAGLDVTASTGCGVVDIGGGTTDMAVISLGGVAVSASCKAAGNAFDRALIAYMRDKYFLLIGERMAEQAKCAIGCARVPAEDRTFAIRGRHVVTGLPASVTLHSADMAEAYAPVLESLTAHVTTMLEQTPPELLSDLYDHGMMLTGGGALLDGLDTHLTDATHVRFTRAERPLECVALGAGQALAYLDRLEATDLAYVNPLTEA